MTDAALRLEPGQRLGPYEVLAVLGRGGMGEVYRARDVRLQREVALKVLPAALAADAEARARFFREAQAVAALSHPHIRALYDVGEDEGVAWAAMELLEGQSLAERLRQSPLGVARALEIATQLAQGLRAAHDKGIVHRDLKPANVFLTKDGAARILDFGLARVEVRVATASESSVAPTQSVMVMGTPGYMAPEQARGEPTDARADLFSLGCVLYEMLSSQPPFGAGSPLEVLSAVLTREPPPLAELGVTVPAGVERVLRGCLEKAPADRVQSAQELLLALQVAATAPELPRQRPAGARRGGRQVLAAIGLVGVGAAIVAFAARWRAPAEAPSFERVTFRRGNVLSARFAPDSQTVVFSAAWEDRPAEAFAVRTGRPEARALGHPNASVRAVARSSDVALVVHPRPVLSPGSPGTLVLVPLEGGATRSVAEDVLEADFAPGGDDFALLRRDGSAWVVEFPAGRELRRSLSRLFQLRVAPDGQRVVVAERTPQGAVLVEVGRDGQERRRTALASDAPRLAWHPSGELWFSVRRGAEPLGLHAIDAAGRRRLVLAGPGYVLHDVARDGRVLLETFVLRDGFLLSRAGGPERDLSWLDDSGIAELTPDAVLFSELGEGGGAAGGVYLRRPDDGLPVRLGDGEPCALSPDGTFALVRRGQRTPATLHLLPTGAGAARDLPTVPQPEGCAWFVPGSKREIAFTGSADGQRHVWLQPLAGGAARAVGAAGLALTGVFSPDGRQAVVVDAEARTRRLDLGDGLLRDFQGIGRGERVVQWLDDGDLLVREALEFPAVVVRADPQTGARRPWRTLAPADRAGVILVEHVAVSRDGASYAYEIARVFSSDLWRVSGLR